MAKSKYKNVIVPSGGQTITIGKDKKLTVPDNPIIPYIEGDGTGPDIWKASVRVMDAAVEKAYGGRRKIAWMEIYAGEKSTTIYGKDVWLPEETLKAIKEFKVAIKGPLTTPVGGGIRSLNVALRQFLDLYACVRPVRWFQGVPAPVQHPEKLNVVIYRENTEDVYAGIEWERGTKEVKALIDFLNKKMLKGSSKQIRPDSGIGIKPISKFGSSRIARMAIQRAIAEKKKPANADKEISLTFVHKGNIMKFTEGAFKDYGYAVARKEFGDQVVIEDDLKSGERAPRDKVLVKNRIADSMFQQVLLRPDEYRILCTPNLNGDYLSDACAAQVGGLGLAPGANIGDKAAMFEATHGTAPKYANLDKINPGSVILSGVMMLEHMGWTEAADMIIRAMEKTIGQDKTVTYDLERQMPGAKLLKCSEFGTAIINNMSLS